MKRILAGLGILAAGIAIGFAVPVYAMPFCESLKSTPIQPVQSVINEFNPSLQPMLESIPIRTHYGIESSMALTCLNVPADKVAILVSPAFNTFSQDFQNDLLLHEYLNIIGAAKINLTQFNADLNTWYGDSSYGSSDVSSNYFKYTLWFNLYQSGGIKESKSDEQIDTYAFIGGTLNDNPQLDTELPANIQDYYKGVLNQFYR